MSSINFDNPWLLLIAVPLIVLFTVPFAIAIRKDNVNGHNITSGIIHVLMAVLIAFAAAGTCIVTTETQTDVYVVADVSYSASHNLDTVDSYIVSLSKNLPDNSRMGVVCFGKDHKLVTRLGEKFSTVKNSGVDDSTTNIVDALAYTGSLFRSDVIKRIVLITDGRATDGSDANALQRQVNALADRNIRVDAIFLDDNMDGDITEVQISDADVTPSVTVNKQTKAQITVEANCKEGGQIKPIIEVYKNEDTQPYITLTPTLTDGTKTISFDLYTMEEGVYNYRAVIKNDDDFNPHNNEITFTQTVSGNTKVLLISNDLNDYTSLKTMCGEGVEIDSKIGITNVPFTVESLCVYDQIVLSDIDVTTLDNYKTFIKSLNTVVNNYGKSLLTFGDTYIGSHQDGSLKSLDDMLPVNFGTTGDELYYTLLIDTSRSMGFHGKLDRAKNGAKEIIKMLSDNAQVSIISFNGDVFVQHGMRPIVNPVTHADNRKELMQTVDELELRQGTVISAGLKEALREMTDKGGEKRVLLISDGLNAISDNPIDSVKELRAHSVFTSALDVGRSSFDSTSSNGKTTLQNIADAGNGLYIDISTDKNLEDVVNGEIIDELGNNKIYYSPIAVNSFKDKTLDGIDQKQLTSVQVSDIIKSTAKGNVSTVLTVCYEGAGQSGVFINVPLYSYWTWGSGVAASYTGSLQGVWDTFSEDVSGKLQELKNKLFSNVLTNTVPEEKTDYPFNFNVVSGTGTAEITVVPSDLRNDGWAEISVTMPDGTSISGDMAFGSRSYNYTFVTGGEGRYDITVTYGHGDRNDKDVTKFTATRYLNVAYSAEYDSFAIYDKSSLMSAIGGKGEVSDDGNLAIVNDEEDVGLTFVYLTMPLLVACAVLFAVDIAVRKLKLEDIKSLFRRGKK